MTIRQTVTTICDGPHQEEEVSAQTIQLAVSGLNGGPGFNMVEVDYCPEHGGPLANLVEDMVRDGRPFYAPGLRKAKPHQKAQAEKPTRKRRAEKAEHICPDCGRSFAKANGLAIHVGRTHGKATAAA